jgi:flagellar basal-body rod protein FlgB
MEPVSSSLILKALDSLSLRATVTAQNIANANSPGYRPMRVTFEEALQRAASGGVDAIRAVQPQVAATLDVDGGTGLRLDLELATASSTAGRYASLVEILNRQLQLDALALSGVR